MQIKTYNQELIELQTIDIDTASLIALPALIDAHVHFRTPGAEHKENWESGAMSALAGGVTTVLDMPNNTPSITTLELLENKVKIVTEQLKNIDIPLHKYFYLGATADNLDEIEKCKNHIIGVKIFMGASTGNLLVDDFETQEKIFQKCADLNLIVAIHAEDDKIINTEKAKFPHPTVNDHGKIRPSSAATTAVKNAITLAEKTGAKLYILHASTRAEIDLIRQAKQTNPRIFVEVSPHHLFLTQEAYEVLGTKGQMNPPLRPKDDVAALWEALNDGVINTIGTDHAPHTLAEKSQLYPDSPSGVPGIETYLPLLLDAHNHGKISLEKIVELTHKNPQKIFGLKETNDWVLIDLNKEKTIVESELKTKCGWSPFAGWKLKGWPVYTILRNKIYKI